MPITHETRRESYLKVLPNLSERQSQVLSALSELEAATANELAMHMEYQGIFPYFSRNFVHPRLNELVAMGAVKVIGKRKDTVTDRTTSVYMTVSHEAQHSEAV